MTDGSGRHLLHGIVLCAGRIIRSVYLNCAAAAAAAAADDDAARMSDDGHRDDL